VADREVIPQALTLNPVLFKTIYADMLNTKKTASHVKAALDAADEYLSQRAAKLLAPIIDYLREAGEARSASEIESFFKRQFNVEYVTIACEYLAEQGLIGKASIPMRLTKKSNADVQELAFVYLSR
jgi:hypothetical protein